MRKIEVIIFIIILLSFVVGIYFYPLMPEKMASHWNAQGKVDDYISKFWGLFLMPFISVGIFLLFILIPKIDPLKANIQKFRKYFDNFILIIILFLFYLYFLTIFWNLGYRFNFSQFLAPAFGIFFYYCGILVENAQKNWFVGIRTPWSLSNDRVWEKTHKIGGKLFKVSGVIAFLGAIYPRYAILFVFVPVVFISIYTIIYSYFEYQKEIKNSD